MVWWSAHASSSRCARSSTLGVPFDPQNRKPAAAAQIPPTVQIKRFMCLFSFFSCVCSPSSPDRLPACGLDAGTGGLVLLRSLVFATLRRTRCSGFETGRRANVLFAGGRGRLHFEDGHGSLWTRTWDRSAAGGEDAGDCGGRGHGREPIGQRRERGWECRPGRAGAWHGRLGRDGAKECVAAGQPAGNPDGGGNKSGGSKSGGDPGAGSDRTPRRGPNRRPGSRCATGSPAREPALRRGSMGTRGAALRSALAGGCGRLLWDGDALRPGGRLEVAGWLAWRCRGSPAAAWRGGDAGALRVLLRQQLCARPAARAAAVRRQGRLRVFGENQGARRQRI